jgi:hypothetical protein
MMLNVITLHRITPASLGQHHHVNISRHFSSYIDNTFCQPELSVSNNNLS